MLLQTDFGFGNGVVVFKFPSRENFSAAHLASILPFLNFWFGFFWPNVLYGAFWLEVPAVYVLGTRYSKSYPREEWRIHHPLGEYVEKPSSLEPSCEINFLFVLCYCWGFSGGSVVKNLPANAGDTRDSGLIPGWGRSTEAGNGNPLQYSCLENSVHKEAWWAAVQAWWAVVHWVAESDTTEQLSVHCYCWAFSLSLSILPLLLPL